MSHNRNYSAKHFIGSLSTLVLFALLLQACSTTRKATQTSPDKPIVTEIDPEQYINNTLDWKSFSSKADLHIETKNQNQDVNSTIRMTKDNAIWASILALGITEIARAAITPDSLKAVVRIGKKAYALSYEEGLELIQTQVEFPVLQNLFIGNPLMKGVPVKKWHAADSTVTIEQEKDGFKQTLVYAKQNATLQKLFLVSDEKGFSIEIDYGKYGPLKLKQPFSYSRKMVINNKGENMRLDIEYNKPEIDVPVETNFNIPNNYERVPVKKKQ